MTETYLLDTNIIIALFAQDSSILSKIATMDIVIPSITIGELYFGAEKSTKKAENRARVDQLTNVSTVIDCTDETAKFYGKIKAGLKTKGTPIPDNDVWIAAIAMEQDFVLVSRDSHFENVEDINWERW